MRERRQRREKAARTPWYLLTGFLLGLAVGAIFSIWVWPVPYDFARPSDLNAESRDQYRLLVARAYLASHDSGRAYPRLDLLKEAQPASVLAAQAQRSLGTRNEADSEALAFLAEGLDQSKRIQPTAEAGSAGTPVPTLAPETTNTPSGILSQLPTSEATPELVRSGTVYPTIGPLNIPSAEIPRATPTMFPTLSAPYILKDKAVDCGQNLRPGLLQIWVENAKGIAMPGVNIQINWKDGEETFFTGLKPELNAGYADYEMTAGVTYSLRVGENGETISGLGTADCAPEGHPERVGGMILRFTEK
jgi:hypothetical protein